MRITSFFILLVSFSGILFSQTFTSDNYRVQLLELYSSQGCSSCPPAERWMSQLKHHPDLWIKFVPVAFHVDYWDYLGWKDPFSSHAFSQRQRSYYTERAVNSVYTPGFLLDGKEWRGWYRNRPFHKNRETENSLQASLHNNRLIANFSPARPAILNVALLGFDLQTSVLSGENHNKTFSEDFIVLSLQSLHSNNANWTLPAPSKNLTAAGRYALAIWVNFEDSLKPVQATGGWIK